MPGTVAPVQLALDVDRPDTGLQARYQAALKLLKQIDEPEDRMALLSAVIWPRDTRLRGDA